MAMPGAVSAITQMAMPASKGGLSPAREGLRRNPRPAARPEHDFAGAQAGAPRQETTGSIMVHATTESPSKNKGSGNLRPGHSPGAEDCVGGREDGARGAANSGGTAPDTTKWNWVPCENRPELLTYHDGKKRWFHCSKCEYWNDRLYHTKMHYERIHVKQGRAMQRKRKYVDPGDSCNLGSARSPEKFVVASTSAGTPQQKPHQSYPMETPPKGKAAPSSSKNTPAALSKLQHGAGSPAKTLRGGKPKGFGAASKPSVCAGKGKGKPCLDKVTSMRGNSWVNTGEDDDDNDNKVFFTFGSLFVQHHGARFPFDVAAAPQASRIARAGPAIGGVGGDRGGAALGVGSEEARPNKKSRVSAGFHGCEVPLGSAALPSQYTMSKSATSLPQVLPIARGPAGAESSSGLEDESPDVSPRRMVLAAYTPATPLRDSVGSRAMERSPALGDGMQALQGLEGLHGMSSAGGSPRSSGRAGTGMLCGARSSGQLASTKPQMSAPDSIGSKMHVPTSPTHVSHVLPPPCGMTEMQAMEEMAVSCLAEASPTRRSCFRNNSSVPVTPNVDRFTMQHHGNLPMTPSSGMPRTVGRGGREGSSEFFGGLNTRTPTYPVHLYNIDDTSLLCNEYLGPFQ